MRTLSMVGMKEWANWGVAFLWVLGSTPEGMCTVGGPCTDPGSLGLKKDTGESCLSIQRRKFDAHMDCGQKEAAQARFRDVEDREYVGIDVERLV